MVWTRIVDTGGGIIELVGRLVWGIVVGQVEAKEEDELYYGVCMYSIYIVYY